MELHAEEDKHDNMDTESTTPSDVLAGLKRVYLFSYNLLQFLGFSWIFITMTTRLLLQGQGALYEAWQCSAAVLYVCQILAVLEVINPALGLVRTGVFPAMLQVVGRNVVLFVIFGSLPEMQNRAVVFFVFYLWSSIEICRYPFYMLACVGMEWRVLTWLRYTTWMPLYPLGMLAEAVAVFQSLRMFDETGLHSIPLPSSLAQGRSISFSFTLKLYLGGMLLGLFINIRHLLNQRRRRCHSKKKAD